MSSLLNLFEQSLHDLYTARYTQLTPTVWLAYSYMLTFSDEVNLFWNRRWSLPQLLFFLIRYPPIAWEIFLLIAYFDPHDSAHFCEIWGHQILVASGITVIYTLHAILILRLYGLYGSKRLIYGLSILLCLAFGAELYIAVRFSPTFFEIDLGPGIGHVCITENIAKVSYVWIPVLTFEISVFLLALYKGIEQFKNGALQTSHLMQIMIRDSLAYFLLVVAVDIGNLIVWIYVRPTLQSVTFAFTGSLMSILGSQMLMNIRLEAQPQDKDINNSDIMPTSVNSTLDFRRAATSGPVTDET